MYEVWRNARRAKSPRNAPTAFSPVVTPCWICFCLAAHCSSLRYRPVGAGAPPRPPPRDTGNVASSLLQTPWRSGSPHGVLGDVQFAGSGPPLNAVITSGGAVAAALL